MCTYLFKIILIKFILQETASFDEVQASTKLPELGKPTVAVLGLY